MPHHASIIRRVPRSLLDSHREPRRSCAEFIRSLVEQLLPVRYHQHAPLHLKKAGQRRKDDGLASAGR
jgi:hypothetical protein